MRPSLRLARHAARITLFTNPNCSLCDSAKSVLAKVQARRAFELQEVNIHEPGQEKWRDVYGFDTPVIHVRSPDATQPEQDTPAIQKLMHRFSEDQVEQKLDQVEKGET